MESIKTNIADKLKVLNDVHTGTTHFLKTYSMYVSNNSETWESLLTEYRDGFKDFIRTRDNSPEDISAVLQCGVVFVGTSKHFFRSEYIKENVPLTEKEHEEMADELAEGFQDAEVRQDILKLVAAVGWHLYTLLETYIDAAKVEAELEKRRAMFKIVYTTADLLDKVQNSHRFIQNGNILLEKLESINITVNTDNTLTTLEGQPLPEEIKDRLKEDEDSIFRHDDPIEFTELEEPLSKLLFSCKDITIKL